MSYPFTRKNLLSVTATFIAANGTGTQPTEAIAVVNSRDKVTKCRRTDNIPLAFSPTLSTVDCNGNAVTLTNVWTGAWDSSVASDGVVEWLVYGDGALQAASQGRFQLLANLANLATP